MISLAQCLLEAGYAVHRINMRSCGGTEHLTDTLYHSGLTQDVRAILEKFQAEQRGLWVYYYLRPAAVTRLGALLQGVCC